MGDWSGGVRAPSKGVMAMQDYSGYGQPPYGSTTPMPPMPPRPPRHRAGALSYLLVALVAGALGAGSVVALYHPAAASNSAAAQPSASAPAPLPSAAIPQPSSGSGSSGTSASEQAILDKVEPGLVIINTTLQYNSEQAAGTGMVINPDGLVLTNNHVIEDSTSITATTWRNGKQYQAKVVGYDVTGDIALIQLQGASGLHTVPLGDSIDGQDRSPGRRHGQRRGPERHRARRGPGHRAEPDHHRERLGRLDHLGDPARDDPDQRGRRVR